MNKSNKTAAGLLYIEIYEDLTSIAEIGHNSLTYKIWTLLNRLAQYLFVNFTHLMVTMTKRKKNISQDQSGGNTDEPQDINDKIQPAPEAKVGAHAKFKPDNDNQKYPYDIRHYNKYRHKINKYWHLIGNTG